LPGRRASGWSSAPPAWPADDLGGDLVLPADLARGYARVAQLLGRVRAEDADLEPCDDLGVDEARGLPRVRLVGRLAVEAGPRLRERLGDQPLLGEMLVGPGAVICRFSI
jgi:hypothetical protein